MVKDEGEALRLANDSQYGLSATLWTRDADKALRLAKQIASGSVCVNDGAVTYGVLEAPFGGRKASGLGHVNGMDALKSYCFAQPIVLNRFGGSPPDAGYPYTADKGAALQRVMRFVFGTRLGRLLT